PDQYVKTGETVTLNGSGSFDYDGYIVEWLWDFDASDGVNWSHPNATGMVVRTSYSTPGTYNVTLLVEDNKGANATDWCLIYVAENVPPVVDANGPYYINEGEGVTLDASGSYDPDGSIVSWLWDLDNDGQYDDASGESPYINWNTLKSLGIDDDGTYAIGLKVEDNDGGSNIDTTNIVVSNVAPAVNAPPDISGNEGSTVTIGTTTFSDPGADTFTATINWGDGNTDNLGTVSSPISSMSHTYNDNGIYTVAITVTDDNGGSGSDTLKATISNVAPTISNTPNKQGYEGDPITFVAGNVNDPGADTFQYRWDWDNNGVWDTSWISSNTATHTWNDDYSGTVKVQVKDDDGGIGNTDSCTVTVLNKDPTTPTDIAFTPSYVEVGDTLIATANGSTDVSGDTITYYYKFYDVTAANLIQDWSTDNDIVVTSGMKNHVIRVFAKAMDEDGGESGEYYEEMMVMNKAPVSSFNFSPQIAFPHEIIVFNASSSYDSDGHIVSYSWNFGDGSNGYGKEVNHSYMARGRYPVTLTVMDDDGSTNSTTIFITVTDKPIAKFNFTINSNVTTFNASSSYDPDGYIVNYTWEFGDGSIGYGVIVEHSYAMDGVYTVNLTVLDNQSCENSTSKSILMDVTPPSTTLITFPSSPNGMNGWFISKVNIEIQSHDNVSGVKKILYKINNDGWKKYSGNFSIEKDGVYTITYYAIDNSSNYEVPHHYEIKIDSGSPHTFFNASRNLSHGWYKGSVTISLNSTDDISGVEKLYYRLDGGVYEEYKGKITVEGDGIHILEYFATDEAGNWEDLVRREIKIDSSPPTIHLYPSGGIYLFGRKLISSDLTIIMGSITIQADVYDGGSGIKEVKFYVDDDYRGNDSSPPYQWFWNDFSLGSHVIKAVAYDNAGHKSEKE
ncbi:MAG: hypothetical protein DRN08_05090, partial [Thermoplasmata archaeon]